MAKQISFKLASASAQLCLSECAFPPGHSSRRTRKPTSPGASLCQELPAVPRSSLRRGQAHHFLLSTLHWPPELAAALNSPSWILPSINSFSSVPLWLQLCKLCYPQQPRATGSTASATCAKLDCFSTSICLLAANDEQQTVGGTAHKHSLFTSNAPGTTSLFPHGGAWCALSLLLQRYQQFLWVLLCS